MAGLKYEIQRSTLAQETTANYLRDHLGWESVYAYNTETLGKEGTLGRSSESDVVLTRRRGADQT